MAVLTCVPRAANGVCMARARDTKGPSSHDSSMRPAVKRYTLEEIETLALEEAQAFGSKAGEGGDTARTHLNHQTEWRFGKFVYAAARLEGVSVSEYVRRCVVPTAFRALGHVPPSAGTTRAEVMRSVEELEEATGASHREITEAILAGDKVRLDELLEQARHAAEAKKVAQRLRIKPRRDDNEKPRR